MLDPSILNMVAGLCAGAGAGGLLMWFSNRELVAILNEEISELEAANTTLLERGEELLAANERLRVNLLCLRKANDTLRAFKAKFSANKPRDAQGHFIKANPAPNPVTKAKELREEMGLGA